MTQNQLVCILHPPSPHRPGWLAGSVMSLWSNRIQFQDFRWNCSEMEALFWVAGVSLEALSYWEPPARD